MNRKIVLSIVLGFIIISAIVVVFLYREKLFTNKVIIRYADGCEETYVNMILITPECTYGRQLEHDALIMENSFPARNISFKNLSGHVYE